MWREGETPGRARRRGRTDTEGEGRTDTKGSMTLCQRTRVPAQHRLLTMARSGENLSSLLRWKL